MDRHASERDAGAGDTLVRGIGVHASRLMK